MKKTMFTILVLVISLLFVSTHLVERVSADSSSIQIDGNFNDWDNVPGTKFAHKSIIRNVFYLGLN